MMIVLPADIYVVINKNMIDDSMKQLISILYQPIIGHTAVSLYYTLLDDLDKTKSMSEDLTHHHLMATMQLDLDEIVSARRKLEATGLMKTFYKKDHVNYYVYQLYAPISAAEFLNHPILNIVLYNNLGKKEYDKIVGFYKLPRVNLKEFSDVTAYFDEVFTSVPKGLTIENEDIKNNQSTKLLLKKGIDISLLISAIPKNMVNDKCFSDDAVNLINSLCFTYNIDELSMQGLVRDSLNEKGMIDAKVLRKSCRDFYQFENNGKLPTLVYATQPEYLKSPHGDQSKWAKMVETFESLTPYDYLKSKYKGGNPTARDLKLVESLLADLKLPAGVVNVLIAYVLKINNQNLSRSYVEAIAGQWKRLNIETVEDAMRISEKEHKKMKKLIEKKTTSTKVVKKEKEILPDWFDQPVEKVASTKEEEQELTDLLKELTN